MKRNLFLTIALIIFTGFSTFAQVQEAIHDLDGGGPGNYSTSYSSAIFTGDKNSGSVSGHYEGLFSFSVKWNSSPTINITHKVTPNWISSLTSIEIVGSYITYDYNNTIIYHVSYSKRTSGYLLGTFNFNLKIDLLKKTATIL